MNFTNLTKINGGKPRKTGYYWVVWHMEPNGVDEYKRVGFYSDKFCQWSFPGDARWYHDSDLLDVYEIPVDHIPQLKRSMRLIVISAVIVLLIYAVYIVKFLITFIKN